MEQPKDALKNFGARSVLIVEDLELNQRLLKHIVENWGLQTDIADNGAIALEKLRQNNYDFVLMDIQMPVMDGVEATLQIRSWDRPKADILIIAVTANSLNEDVIKYLAAGIDDVVEKPIDELNLLNVISKNLQKRKFSSETKRPMKLIHSSEDPIYSLEILKALSNDEQFIKDMVLMFVRSIPEYIDLLTKFGNDENWEELKGVAHKIKGTVSYIKVDKVMVEVAIIRNYELEDKRNVKAATERLIQILGFCAEVMERELPNA